MLLSFNERASQGTRTIFYSIVILPSTQRKLLSVVSANCRPDATADPGSHVLSSLAWTNLVIKFPSAPTPDPPVRAVVTQMQAVARPAVRALMFKRCSQESWAVTCPGPTRNPNNATAEGKAVINPEIQALEVFGRKASICSLS